jgi:YidC/Oxa1 family membrane protein insertase
MQAVAPKIEELRARHQGDRQTLRLETMKLYQAERVNPLMGCLPLLLQLPIFFGLYHVLATRNPLGFEPYTDVPKTLYGWTVEQFDSAAAAHLFSAPITASVSTDATRLAALGGADPSAARIVGAVLVVLMAVTTFLAYRQTMTKAGPQRGEGFALYAFPVLVLVVGLALPIGVSVYWITQNLISLAQQAWVLRRFPAPAAG